MADAHSGFSRADIADLAANERAHSSITYMWMLAFVTLALSLFGLMMLYSATSAPAHGLSFFRNQLLWMILGSLAGAVVFMVGYRRIMSARYWWMFLCMALLGLALCFPAVNGAQRWIRLSLGGVELSIQPSEIAKVVLVIFVAKYCSDNFHGIGKFWSFNGLLPLFGGSMLLLGGILMGRDYGTTILSALSAWMVMLAAGVRMRYLLLPIFGIVGLGLNIYFNDPVRWARFTAFMDPKTYADGTAYQLWNSLMALGSGGWFGMGFAESRLKADYLPEAHTDFILAIVGEELGLCALLLLMGAYALFAWCGIKICFNSNRQGAFLGFGLTMAISLQVMINIITVSGAGPTKGMNAPFISYGGSNLLMSLVAVGLLMSIAAETAYPEYNKPFWAFWSKIHAKATGIFRKSAKC